MLSTSNHVICYVHSKMVIYVNCTSIKKLNNKEYIFFNCWALALRFLPPSPTSDLNPGIRGFESQDSQTLWEISPTSRPFCLAFALSGQRLDLGEIPACLFWQRNYGSIEYSWIPQLSGYQVSSGVCLSTSQVLALLFSVRAPLSGRL